MTASSGGHNGHLEDHASLVESGAAIPWHAVPLDEVFERLSTGVNGLDDRDAKGRLSIHGPNELPREQTESRLSVFVRQFRSPLIYILVAAALLSFGVGEFVDAGTILVIVVFNSGVGYLQEWRAAEAIRALQRMLSATARVRRQEIESEIDARELVPGDVCILEVGARVPADLRLLTAAGLTIDESALTGESVPVPKAPGAAKESAPVVERSNSVFMGTVATNGWAEGVVVATGSDTELGQISLLTAAVTSEETPLRRQLNALSRYLGVLAIGAGILVVAVGLIQGRDALDILLTGISLAVAAIPEGLPAVVTIGLALGVREMARRRVLIRRLAAVEGLGSVSVICSDKTGTFTENQMTVSRIVAGGERYEVEGSGYEPTGRFIARSIPIDPLEDRVLTMLLETGILANHAVLQRQEGEYRVVGDPTEGSLIVAANKAGILTGEGGLLDVPSDPTFEFSFSADRRRMTRIFSHGRERVAHMKGAPNVVLERCRFQQIDDELRELTEQDRRAARDAAGEMASGGLRTLALARRVLPQDMPMDDADMIEQEMVYLGVVGMLDPPRSAVPGALRVARKAGIDVIMITGDAAPTARAIARQVGLPAESSLTGEDLAGMTDQELLSVLGKVKVFARVSPRDKLRIVSVLQADGQIVGVTGDGVNDAPALRRADVGISMGLHGTDVAKGASDLVLSDDDFAGIVSGIQEGRRQGNNIRKFVRYLVSSNIGEVVAVVAALSSGTTFILLPVQILWMNLVTDGPTGLALGVEPAEADDMKRAPADASAPILSRNVIALLATVGLYLGLTAFFLFRHELDAGASDTRAQTMALTTLVILQKVNALNFRSFTRPLMRTAPFSNPALLGAIALTLGFQVAAVYAPPLQAVLHTTALNARDWGLIFLLGVPLIVAGEIFKMTVARRTRR